MRFNGFLKFEEFVENVEFNAEHIQHTISHKTGFDNFSTHCDRKISLRYTLISTHYTFRR